MRAQVPWAVHIKFASHDWLFLDPPGISKTRGVLKLERECCLGNNDKRGELSYANPLLCFRGLETW